jgi:hypothetical protein
MGMERGMTKEKESGEDPFFMRPFTELAVSRSQRGWAGPSPGPKKMVELEGLPFSGGRCAGEANDDVGIFTKLFTLSRFRGGEWKRVPFSVLGRSVGRGSNQQGAALDSQCTSWILRTSLEKGVCLQALKFLATTQTLVGFNQTLVSNSFDILINYTEVNERNPVVV